MSILARILKDRGVVTEQQIEEAIQRQVLYGNAGLDITNDVISRLDQHYNAQKK